MVESRIREPDLYDYLYDFRNSDPAAATYYKIAFPIRPNLQRALRLSDRPRNLWIDAVCIDQTNDAEKSVQVSKMAYIYRCVEDVCVWLDIEASHKIDPEVAMNAMLEIAENNSLHQTIMKDKGKGSLWRLSCVTRLLNNPWYATLPLLSPAIVSDQCRLTRRWVVQEIAFAKKVTVHWVQLRAVIAILFDWANTLKPNPRMKESQDEPDPPSHCRSKSHPGKQTRTWRLDKKLWGHGK